MLYAGAGKALIDLEGVLPFDGFDVVRDPLHVRAVAFGNPDGNRACIVSVDATSMRDDAPMRAKAAQVTGLRVRAKGSCVVVGLDSEGADLAHELVYALEARPRAVARQLGEFDQFLETTVGGGVDIGTGGVGDLCHVTFGCAVDVGEPLQ